MQMRPLLLMPALHIIMIQYDYLNTCLSHEADFGIRCMLDTHIHYDPPTRNSFKNELW